MRELSLFSGAGGGLLGTLLLGWTPVGYVETNEYCQKVIAQRIKDGHLPLAPIFGDIRTFARRWARGYQGLVDVVTAGFPCQPFSIAGKRQGESDARNMWPWTIRVIRQVRPYWCLLENTPTLLSTFRRYYGQILRDLAEAGYDAEWGVLSAADVGAPHLRKRVWIVAYANEIRWDGRPGRESRWRDESENRSDVSHSQGQQKRSSGQPWANVYVGHSDSFESGYGHDGTGQVFGTEFEGNEEKWKTIPKTKWWDAEPGLDRVANGVANRMDRIRAIGNGQVPAVVRAAWRLMT